ncbi:ubiquinone biosynthesis monooxygenase Coq7 [Blyttiomyces sp. JEL0837]|nr:ubiquinone biosynthesis monooxygenase Coq7 [Blyttiomyces sp. JEL0837]
MMHSARFQLRIPTSSTILRNISSPSPSPSFLSQTTTPTNYKTRSSIIQTCKFSSTSVNHDQQQQHDNPASPPKSSLTPDRISKIHAMLRVDHAGELGADAIYRGQLAVLKSDAKVGSVIQHMWDQERKHLEVMNKLVSQNRVRPTALMPFWNVAGFALGFSTALLGKEAAMACTEAVEDVINEHYNDQIRELLKIEGDEEVSKLREVIREFRDDEMGHMNTAIDYDAKQAPLYTPLTGAIKQVCKTAIWVASRV